MRNIPLKNNEFYHIFNRGVDKRTVFLDGFDYARFLRSLKEFNQVEPVVSIYILDQLKSRKESVVSGTLQKKKLVEIIAFNLIPNHFHLILKQLKEGGISEFMRRLGNGYTRYFNYKYKRNGVLFQGKFQAAHIDSNEKLIYLSAYVNGNHKIHGVKNDGKFSSLTEYKHKNNFSLCNTGAVLNQFSSIQEYLNYVKNTTGEIREIREDFKNSLLESL